MKKLKVYKKKNSTAMLKKQLTTDFFFFPAKNPFSSSPATLGIDPGWLLHCSEAQFDSGT